MEKAIPIGSLQCTVNQAKASQHVLQQVAMFCQDVFHYKFRLDSFKEKLQDSSWSNFAEGEGDSFTNNFHCLMFVRPVCWSGRLHCDRLFSFVFFWNAQPIH